MERVEAELHEPTARSGSLIVSACGFGFVPAEFGFLFHSRQWEVGTTLRAGHRGGVREPAGGVWFDESYSSNLVDEPIHIRNLVDEPIHISTN